MIIFIKIYKRFEDEQKNKITISDFHFEKGYFYFNMETYNIDLIQKQSQFIDFIEMNKIVKLEISQEEAKNLLINN